MVPLVRRFKVSFQVIPVREWSKEALGNGLDPLCLPSIDGELEADLRVSSKLKGTFKTAHSGRVSSPTDGIPPYFHNVCVKQHYTPKSSGAISRLRGNERYRMLLQEVNCLDWAAILLDLTYQFINGAVTTHGEPNGGIPELRFVRVMLAKDTEDDKHFLVEEWIDGNFVKYINNGRADSCVPHDAPKAVHRIAEFLSFAQHVQYRETKGLAYTSDYQGLCYD